MEKNTLEASATLIGMTIGAGILGIPYAVMQSGFFIGMLYILILGLATLLVNLYAGEITLRTKGKHQWTGYAQTYLGKFGKQLMTLILIIGIYGALTAYLIGEGEILAALFNSQNTFFFTLLFFLFASTIVFLGLKALKRSEFILSIFVMLVVVLITFLAFPHMNLNYLSTINLSKLFFPYGVILFAFLGASAIPEMKEELQKKKELKKAILIGTLIPFFIYLLFTLVVIAVTGTQTTAIATLGLGQVVGENMRIMGSIFAALTMATSFIGLGLALKWMYHYDYKLNNALSFFLTCFIPLSIVLLKVTTFIQILALVGAFIGGLKGILIILMYRKAKKYGERKPEYILHLPKSIDYFLITLFIVGILYTLFTFL